MKKGIIACLCIVPSLMAQASDLSWRFQGGITSPFGSVKNDSLIGTHDLLGGATLAASLSWHLNDINAIQIKVSSSGISQGSDNLLKGEVPADDVTLNSEWRIFTVGVDWRRSWEGTGNRLFTEAGIGFASPQLSLSTRFQYAPGVIIGSTRRTTQYWKPDVRLGVGYNFSKRIFGEVGVHNVFVDKAGADGFGFSTMTWAEVTIGLRFGEHRN